MAGRLTQAFQNTVFLYNLVPHLERLSCHEHSAARRQPMSKHPDFLLLFVDHLSLGGFIIPEHLPTPPPSPPRASSWSLVSSTEKFLAHTDHRISLPFLPRHSFTHFFLLSGIIPSTCFPDSRLNPSIHHVQSWDEVRIHTRCSSAGTAPECAASSYPTPQGLVPA